MRARLIASTVAFISVPAVLGAQATDIYLFDIRNEYRLVAQVTDRDGYDSQPSFTTDAKGLLFTSDRGGKSDIFRYDIATGAIRNLTNTANENEYSGQPWGTDGFMYVLQEGAPYQNVWYQRWDGGAPQRVLTSFIPAGYFVRNRTGVLFWGRYSYSLFFEPAGAEVSADDGESLFVLSQAGISMHAIPGGDLFSFVQKQDDWNWVIKSLDPVSRAIVPLTTISNANENYCWTPSGVLLTAEGTLMRKFEPRVDKEWKPLVTLSAPGLVKGGRCAVSADGRYLALVNTRRS